MMGARYVRGARRATGGLFHRSWPDPRVLSIQSRVATAAGGGGAPALRMGRARRDGGAPARRMSERGGGGLSRGVHLAGGRKPGAAGLRFAPRRSYLYTCSSTVLLAIWSRVSVLHTHRPFYFCGQTCTLTERLLTARTLRATRTTPSQSRCAAPHFSSTTLPSGSLT